VPDEGVDPRFELTRKVIVFEQDAVLGRLIPALGLALGLGMTWRTAKMLDVQLAEPVGEIGRNVAGAIILQQARPVLNTHLVATCSGERLFQCNGDVADGHRSTDPPRSSHLNGKVPRTANQPRQNIKEQNEE
jgi:hypothetical protein